MWFRTAEAMAAAALSYTQYISKTYVNVEKSMVAAGLLREGGVTVLKMTT